jgi:hypothetical protein
MTFNMTSDGQFEDPAAQNALESAINFYEKNSGKESSLGKMDRMKLENAKKAIQLYNGMTQTVSNNYDQQTAMQGPSNQAAPQLDGEGQQQAPDSQPPIEGARQAKDGNWYVEDPNRPGKYLKVN